MADRPPPRAAARAVLGLRAALLRAADRLLPAEVAAFQLSIGFGQTRLMGAVVELGIPDALAAGPATADELARRLDLDADALHRILRAAATRGVVKLDRRGRFRAGRVMKALRSDHPRSMAPWIRYINLASTQDAWAAAPETVRSGTPGFRLVHGTSVWQHFSAHPEEERIFAATMKRMTELDLPLVVAGYEWPDEGTVCDVGGGVGTLLAGILAARPGLRGVLVDAPGVLREAEGFLSERGVRERVELREGDIFEPLDARADVYLLKDILHDWGDERCAKILRSVRAAMAPGARVVLVEVPQERNEVDQVASLIDVHMLTQTDGGRQRSVAELQALLRGAGLEPGEVRLTAAPALVEGVAPAS